ncbi:general transcription factor IIIC, polypeptide 2, beta [Chelydra serpentina]|uniref:General transcription factor IIIC, polypeptide 2, beta n=1 Tax=Chelydra serpentina TaxID=8475 RepID=A0A8T1RWZ3_CHESE|nr:general transcription factor IIIC, polypeptide 2, beta [Chelydra serpentina]
MGEAMLFPRGASRVCCMQSLAGVREVAGKVWVSRPGAAWSLWAPVAEMLLPRAPGPMTVAWGDALRGKGSSLISDAFGAPRALLYLQELAEELTSVYQPLAPNEGPQEPESGSSRKKRRSRRRNEEEAGDGDLSRDVDFVASEEVLLQAAEEEEEESDVLLSEVSESEPEAVQGHTPRMPSAGRSKPQCRGLAPNGFHNSIMAPVWKCPSITHSLRDQHYSPWEFPDWLPSTRKWTFLSESECAQYLPGEMKSPLFSIQREGIEEDGVLYRINRYGPAPGSLSGARPGSWRAVPTPEWLAGPWQPPERLLP